MVATADALLIYICCRVAHQRNTQHSCPAFGIPSAVVALLDIPSNTAGIRGEISGVSSAEDSEP